MAEQRGDTVRDFKPKSLKIQTKINGLFNTQLPKTELKLLADMKIKFIIKKIPDCVNYLKSSKNK